MLLNNDLQQIELNILKNKKVLHILRAINHPLRLKIIKFIDEKKQATVTEIYTELLLEQAIVSQHLAILRRAGFLIAKRQSKFIYYTISYNFTAYFVVTINAFFDQ
jgi:DNA-binding transcriptional ArsR family regulator